MATPQNQAPPPGTLNFIPIWNSSTTLGNSNIFESRATATKGFVGIGTTKPAYNLHIVGGANAQLTIESSVSNGNPSVNVIANTPAGQAQFLASRADGGAPARLVLATAGVPNWAISIPDGNTDELDFYNTSSVPTVTLLQGGQVGIGTQTPSNLLTLVQGGGVAIGDGWTTYSSRRFKTNIQPLLGALEKVEQIQGVSYDRKNDGKHEIGVVAEDIEAVIPEVVSRDPLTRKVQGVDYSRLSALLIEAIKDQQHEIEELKLQLRELTSKP